MPNPPLPKSGSKWIGWLCEKMANHLNDLTRVQNAVCLIKMTVYDKSGKPQNFNSTGFHYGSGWVMTNAHNFQDDAKDKKDEHSVLSCGNFRVLFDIDGSKYEFKQHKRMAFVHHLEPGDDVDDKNKDIAMVKLGIQYEYGRSSDYSAWEEEERGILAKMKSHLCALAQVFPTKPAVGDYVDVIHYGGNDNQKKHQKVKINSITTEILPTKPEPAVGENDGQKKHQQVKIKSITEAEMTAHLSSVSAAPAFPCTKETTNYARLCRLIVDAGSQVLKETFDIIHPPDTLHKSLSNPAEHAKLQSLQTKGDLNPLQWDKLYPAISSSVSSTNFDFPLLMVLLRNICSLTPPVSGWDDLPSATNITREDDIARIRFYRSQFCCQASQASVDDVTFNKCWTDMRDASVRLGGKAYGVAIDNLKHVCMEPEIEEHYRELLKQCKVDKDSIEMTEKVKWIGYHKSGSHKNSTKNIFKKCKGKDAVQMLHLKKKKGDLAAGASGCPVMLEKDDKYHLVGLHFSGDDDEENGEADALSWKNGIREYIQKGVEIIGDIYSYMAHKALSSELSTGSQMQKEMEDEAEICKNFLVTTAKEANLTIYLSNGEVFK